MLVSVIILALYFWAYFADVKSIGAALLVSDTAAITAAAALLMGFLSYLWAPKKYIFWGSYIAFLLLVFTSGVLIANTGETSSPFLALWMLLSVFAAVFGLYGVLPMIVLVALYFILQLMNENTMATTTIPATILGGILPIIVGYFIWHSKSSDEKSSDKAYRELATELSEVAGKSEVVINAIADGVIALDNKGIIQLINPAAQQIIGWGKQDALSLDYKSVLKLVTKDDVELTTANDPILQVLATNKELMTNNLTLLTSTGKKKLVSVIVSPIGQLGSGVIIVFRDITKEKAEEREQAEFISTASHEMRTPVASIEGYLGLALNPATAQVDEKARDFINKAHESAQHLGRLFQDLLDVTKADDGRMSNNPKVVDIVAFTHDITQGLRSKAEEKGLHILFKPQPDDSAENEGGERRLNPVYYANVDNDHLREVTANLIENAIKYTPKGDVIIDVTGDNEHVTISVADTGIGIPKEDQTHLFQKFYRVDNSDTREIGGTGLGLYLSRRLAEAMSGRIRVESEYKRGSTFFLEIPRIDHEEAMRLIEATATPTAAVETPILDVTATPTTNQPEAIQPQPPQPATLPTQTAPTATDATYTNIPANVVAEQLQQHLHPVTQSQPPLVQTYQPPQAPTYNTRPQPQQPVYHTHPMSTHPNTPLSSIEQHPDQYLQRPGGIAVPPRRDS